ncbi:class I SAM-dependent methyltransferase [Streptomyces sp. NBC_01754]|uniref:class I SAM-dependent methyltransferase n=1 Tax=Streptomyces sp. NBC_01754 TaxID=2975930 RepID=UPI002DD9DDDB|nr:class I SAM-dependent methyltransferase [Streptomyces sp. NBC_01754]WSC93797.1 class I SAM-dependent methyltransferase [Streptomyces sp. NBC_01754]
MDLIEHEYADLRALRTRRAMHRAYSSPVDDVDEVTLALARRWAGARGTVVDVGCGTGDLLRRWARDGYAGQLVGVDRSTAAVSGTRGGGVVVVRGDACALPLRDGSADCLLERHMLYHVADLRQALAESRRVVRPGGAFVAVVNMMDTTPRLARLLRDCVSSEGTPVRPFPRVDSESLRPLLKDTFAEVEETEYRGELVFHEPEQLAALAASLLVFYGLERGTARHGRMVEALREEAARAFAGGAGPWRDAKGWSLFVARR